MEESQQVMKHMIKTSRRNWTSCWALKNKYKLHREGEGGTFQGFMSGRKGTKQYAQSQESKISQ